MKFQPKRFVVEVKRGTSRAAFSSPDTSSDKFSSAEATLFGGAPKQDSSPPQAKDKPKPGADLGTETKLFAEPPRRILASLIEEPVAPVIDDEPVERPRRGRKPGSKNKPKLHAPTADGLGTSAARTLSPAAQAFMQRPLASEPLSTARHPSTAGQQSVESARSRAMADSTIGEARPARRQRLRERSSIIKRYVLGTEPTAGQVGSLRARRKARAAG